MDAERRRQLLLSAVVIALGFTIYTVWQSPASVTPSSVLTGRRQTSPPAGSPPGLSAPDVHLDALEGDRAKPAAAERDLFRFRPKAAPPPPPRTAAPPIQPPAATEAPAPPTVPPIALKFIGVLEPTDRPGKIAVLSDGRDVFHGREGDIIEGRYRILKIGAESIEMAYLDGRGRQTTRLTGQ